MLRFSPSGNHHFIHPESDDHHYSISSQQNPNSSRRETPTPSNDYPTPIISASKGKWIDAVRTVKQMNQVRLFTFHPGMRDTERERISLIRQLCRSIQFFVFLFNRSEEKKTRNDEVL